MKTELAIIAFLLFPQFIEKAQPPIRKFRNWLERRAIHKRSGQ